MVLNIRDYCCTDSALLNATVLQAFQQYESQYDEWETFCKRIGTMSSLSDEAEIIVAEVEGILCGAMAYYGPGKDQTGYFPKEWASVLLLI